MFEIFFDKLKESFEVPISKTIQQMLDFHKIIKEQQNNLKDFDFIKNEKKIIEEEYEKLFNENKDLQKSKALLKNFVSERENFQENENFYENLIYQNKKMKKNLNNLINSLKESKIKEQKIMKLIYEIRKRGIDIEEIYYNFVQTPAENNSVIYDSNLNKEEPYEIHPNFDFSNFNKNIIFIEEKYK